MRAACWAALALGASACAEPVVETRLLLPSAEAQQGFDVSCVGAVEVYARGAQRGRFPDVPSDDTEACVEVSNPSSFGAIRSAISGRVQLAIPKSGLLGLDLRASTGTCNKDFMPGDTIFYGDGAYDGADITIQLVPNVSCDAKRTETVRPVDLLELTRTGACPAAVPDGIGAEVAAASIHRALLAEAVLDYHNDFAAVTGGVASLPVYTTHGAGACVALEYYNNVDNMYTATCARRGPGVCSTAGQIELPVIDETFAFRSLDTALLEQFGGGAVLGAVWGTDPGNAAAKLPLSGATVRVHPSAEARSKIVYAKLDAASGLIRGDASMTSTDASGLFIAYVTGPADLAFQHAGYTTEIVRLGSPIDVATALIVLQRP